MFSDPSSALCKALGFSEPSLFLSLQMEVFSGEELKHPDLSTRS